MLYECVTMTNHCIYAQGKGGGGGGVEGGGVVLLQKVPLVFY